MKLIQIFPLLVSLVYAVPGLQGACKDQRNIKTFPIDPIKYSGAWYEIAHSKSFYWYTPHPFPIF